MSEDRLVYSTDPARNQKCPGCGYLMPECLCVREEASSLSDYTALLRLETANRGGKSVTVIDRLPRITAFLEDLARTLKKRCGAGGTLRIEGRYGIIEIQGDKREMVRSILVKEGIAFKG